MDQSTARTLAREIGRRAKEHGCQPTDEYNPSIIELAAQCDGRGVDIHAILKVR